MNPFLEGFLGQLLKEATKDYKQVLGVLPKTKRMAPKASMTAWGVSKGTVTDTPKRRAASYMGVSTEPSTRSWSPLAHDSPTPIERTPMRSRLFNERE